MVYHQPRLDATFAALAHPVRREILTRLATGDKTVGELAARFDMSLPAASKHVRVLERAGLARIRREGRVRRTTLVAAPMRDAAAWIERYRRFWETQVDQLAAYLERTTPQEDASWQPRPDNRSSRSAPSNPPHARGAARARLQRLDALGRAPEVVRAGPADDRRRRCRSSHRRPVRWSEPTAAVRSRT